MADRHPIILIGTALAVAAICILVVGQLTYPWRGVAAGIVLALCSAAFIWFAGSRRKAMARSVFSLGATALAAPAAGLAAAQNDLLYNLFVENGLNDDAPFVAYDRAIAIGLPMLGIGAAVAIVLFIIGWRMHRTPSA